ncbi:hypothetical protein CVT25_009338 [Psilocybe cyanescens]|uniref:Cytochrome P450 n=1 Tax=Psilocybe cyanescens TaxID=93625 RepID=A0A409VN84_PSICY|nr:hypothetical protein CVT25_009338 [Psilocybe cyanescens]
MSRDPEKFQNPDVFNPDRYFDEQGNLNLKDQENYVFGFGRRICPGRHMADSSVWLAVTSILSVFDIGHKKDSVGNVIPINIEYTDGLIRCAEFFEYSTTSRTNIFVIATLSLSNALSHRGPVKLHKLSFKQLANDLK